jgi:death-on-curing family protein
MEYLTTHDLVWINTTITGSAEPYNYVTLEAAMAGQYSYGESRDVPTQAANLFSCLLFKAPFAAGNIRTALVAALTFLNANGYSIRVADTEAADIVKAVAGRRITPAQAVIDLCIPSEQNGLGAASLRKLITLECNTHREALELLAGGD